MISFLRGRVAAKRASYAIIEVAGVGYRVLMPTGSLAALPPEGDEALVHTHLHVREDELTLYGFRSEEERAVFQRLIGVSGVGPKVALAVLSSLAPDVLRVAVDGDDVAMLAGVPGIGKKTAQRIIIELKDRLEPAAGAASAASPSGAVTEARDALLSMGFTAAEAGAALRGAEPGASAEDLLRHALRALGGAS